MKNKTIVKSKVDKTFNIKFDVKYLRDGYKFIEISEHMIGETGLMKIFEIDPELMDGPKFIGRWDENKATLDVDIYNVNEVTRDFFRKGKKGYEGHHPDLIRPEHRTYRIYLSILGDLFCEAEIFFNINHSIDITESLRLVDRFK